MADGGENIGGLNVSVGADYSQLLTDFQSMQSAATTAGAAVADSFNTAAASATTFDDAVAAAVASGATLADAVESANRQFESFGESAGGASDEAKKYSDSTQQLIDSQKKADDELANAQAALQEVQAAYNDGAVSAQTLTRAQASLQDAYAQANPKIKEQENALDTAGVSVSGFVKGLLALQASLTALQGLKDFAASALEASDSFKAAQISLANLTGSAAQANQTIGQLVTLAEQDGLSMPALLTAATRMQALLGAAAPVPQILSQLANAGAVSGQGIEAAANALDRLVVSGTVSARTLLPLGISLNDVATAFNALSGTAEATDTNLTQLMKTLSDTDRIAVYQQALSKLGGTAQQVADQTFGGQWNQLIAQWSQVLKAAGDALAPLLSDLVQLAKTDLVPFAQAAAGAFKQFTDTISTVKNTIGGLVDTLKGLADSVPAAKSAWDSFVEAVEKYNTYSLAKDAINELTLGVQALFNITPGATAMTAAMNAELGKLQTAGTAAKGSIDLIGDSIKTLLAADKTTADQFDTDVKALNQITASVSGHTAVIKGNVAGLQDQWAALEKVNSVASGLPSALSSVSLALENDTMAAQKATLQYQAQAGAYQQTLAAFNAGNATLGQVDAAFEKMSQAEQAAAVAGAPVAGSLQAIDQQANAAVNSTKILATNFELAADQARAQKDNIDELNASVLVDSQRLDLLVAKEQQVATAVGNNTDQYSHQLQIKQQITAANTKLIADTQSLETAELRAGNAAADAGGEIGQLKQAQDEANLALDQAKQKYDAGLISTDAYVSAQKAATTAATNLKVAIAENNADLSKSTDGFSLAAAAAAGAEAKLKSLTQAFKDNKASIDDVTSAQNAYVSSQLKLAEQQAVASHGLQDVTDAVNLQDVAVVKAQADVDTYTRLQQQGYDVASQLQSALSTLSTAQDKYNAMVQQGNPLLVTQDQSLKAIYSDQQSLAPVIDTTTTSIGRQVSALQQQIVALNGVSAAVLGVEADMKTAFGNKTTGGPTVNVEQGYHLGGILSGASDFGGQNYSFGLYADPSTIAAQAKVQETQLYDQGYTPQAISKQMALPLSQVLSDLGLKPDQAGQAKSSANIIIGQSTVDLSGLPGGIGGGSGGSGSSTVSSGGSTFAGGSTISAAVDGGSYPAVTAHQAVGEVWAVAAVAGGPTGGGGGSSVITTSISNNVTGSDGASLQAATQAIGSVAQQIATNSGDLLPISQSLLQTAAATQQLATAVAGLVQRVDVGAGSSGTFKVTGGGGTAAPSGPVISTMGGGNPLGQYVPPSSTPIADVPGYNPFGPGSAGGGGSTTINVTVNAPGTIGLNSQQLNAQITAAVVNNLVPQLQTAGARLTR